MPNSLDLDGATPVGNREGETDSGASGRVIVARGRPPIAPTTRRHIIGPRPFVVAAATLDLETPYHSLLLALPADDLWSDTDMV